MRIIIFFAVQLAACAYALWRGGEPERWTAWMMALGTAATAAVPFDPATSFFTINIGTLVVDIAMMLGLVGLASRADRFWPMWVAALQVVAIFIHVVRGIDPTILPAVYNQSAGKIAYPMIILLVVGTFRHHARSRERLDKDWSELRW